MRSIVVIASVATGLFAGMFMMAFFVGMINQEIDSEVETTLSHIQMHNPAFPDDKAANFTIDSGQQIVAHLRKDVNVKAVSARVITTGMISSSSTATGAEIHGVVAADEQAISSIAQDMREGVYFSEGKHNEIVMGEKLAQKLGVKLHSKVVLTFQSRNGDLTAGSFRVAGIFRSRNSGFDETTVFTRFEDLAPLLETGEGIHEIAVMLRSGTTAAAMAGSLKKEYPALLIQTWTELSPEIALVTGVFDQIMYILIGIILLALMFGIINTMLMAVLERQREFGMLMAIGMNKKRVFSMVVLETILLTCAGIPAGILLTIGAVAYLGRHGIDLSSYSQGLMQYGFSNRVFPQLQTSMFLPITVMTAVTAVLSAIYPALKALQFKPATAIHKI